MNAVLFHPFHMNPDWLRLICELTDLGELMNFATFLTMNYILSAKLINSPTVNVFNLASLKMMTHYFKKYHQVHWYVNGYFLPVHDMIGVSLLFSISILLFNK